MKTHKDLIQYHKNQFLKVMSAYGLDSFKSDATTAAFFRLQAAKIGVPEDKIFAWATKKTEEIHEEALTLL
jgi:hypothetical protein